MLAATQYHSCNEIFWDLAYPRILLLLCCRKGACKALQVQACALHAWQDVVYTKAVNEQKNQHLMQLRLRHVIHQWIQFTKHQQQLHQQMRRAQLWRKRKTVTRCFGTWFNMYYERTQRATEMATRLLEIQGRAAVQVSDVQHSKLACWQKNIALSTEGFAALMWAPGL